MLVKRTGNMPQTIVLSNFYGLNLSYISNQFPYLARNCDATVKGYVDKMYHKALAGLTGTLNSVPKITRPLQSFHNMQGEFISVAN